MDLIRAIQISARKILLMPAGWLDKRNARLLAEAEEAIRTETKESQQFKVNQAQQREAIRRDPDQADGWGG